MTEDNVPSDAIIVQGRFEPELIFSEDAELSTFLPSLGSSVLFWDGTSSNNYISPESKTLVGLLGLLGILTFVAVSRKRRGRAKPRTPIDELTPLLEAHPVSLQRPVKTDERQAEAWMQPLETQEQLADKLVEPAETGGQPIEEPAERFDTQGEHLRTSEELVESQKESSRTSSDSLDTTETRLDVSGPPQPAKTIPQVEDEILFARAAEKKVDNILLDAKSLIDTISVNRRERHHLETAYEVLMELKSNHSMLLMDNITLQDFTLQTTALKATCMYLEALVQVKSCIKELRETFEGIYGSKTMQKIIAANIVVTTKSVKKGNFADEPPYDKEEMSWLIDSEKNINEVEDEKQKANFTRMVAPFETQLKAESVTRTIRSQLQSMEFAGAHLSSTLKNALNIMGDARAFFRWEDYMPLRGFTALTDLLKTLTDFIAAELNIWKRIEEGVGPASIQERQQYHDKASIANICFDGMVRLREKTPLPRDLLTLLSPTPTLHSPDLQHFVPLQQQFIKWGDVLFGVLVNEASLVKPPSITMFDFHGMLWRPFAETWLLRSHRERRLIKLVNKELTGKSDRPFAFTEALKRTNKFSRPAIAYVLDQWHPLSEDSMVCKDEQERARKERERAETRIRELATLRIEVSRARSNAEIAEEQVNRVLNAFHTQEKAQRLSRKAKRQHK